MSIGIQSGHPFRRAKGPLAEGEVGGDDDRGLLVELADHMGGPEGRARVLSLLSPRIN